MPVFRENMLKIEDLEHVPEKWMPVFRENMLKIEDLERVHDSAQTERALAEVLNYFRWQFLCGTGGLATAGP